MIFDIIIVVLVVALVALLVCTTWLPKHLSRRRQAALTAETEAARLVFSRQFHELLEAAQQGDRDAMDAVMEIKLERDTYRLLKWPDRLTAAEGRTWTLSLANGKAIIDLQIPVLTARFIAEHSAELASLIEAWHGADERAEQSAIMAFVRRLAQIRSLAKGYAYVETDIEAFFESYEPELKTARTRFKAIYQARLDELLTIAASEEGNRDAMVAAQTLLTSKQVQDDLKLVGLGFLTYPDNWPQLVCRYYRNPLLAIYGEPNRTNTPSDPKEVGKDDRLALRAARAIRTGDAAEAKLVLAYCKVEFIRGGKSACHLRRDIGEILFTDIVKFVDYANTHEFAGTAR